MKNRSLLAGQALMAARDALLHGKTGEYRRTVADELVRVKDLLIGESLSWIMFRERIERAYNVIKAGTVTSKAQQDFLLADLKGLLDHGRLPDEISAATRHEEQMAALQAIRRDTALLTAHTVECWVDPEWSGCGGESFKRPRKCAYHPTHKWTHDLCPVHRAYLGLAADERFTPPPWLKQ